MGDPASLLRGYLRWSIALSITSLTRIRERFVTGEGKRNRLIFWLSSHCNLNNAQVVGLKHGRYAHRLRHRDLQETGQRRMNSRGAASMPPLAPLRAIPTCSR